MSDLRDLKSFTSDRDLTRTKSLLKPTPVYPEDVSGGTSTDQGSSFSHSETSGHSQGWIENEETPPIGEPLGTKGFKYTPSNRDPRWLNRVKLDHSLPGNQFSDKYIVCLIWCNTLALLGCLTSFFWNCFFHCRHWRISIPYQSKFFFCGCSIKANIWSSCNSVIQNFFFAFVYFTASMWTFYYLMGLPRS